MSREVLVRKFRGDFGAWRQYLAYEKGQPQRMWPCKGSQRKGSYWVWGRKEGEYHPEANVGNFRYYIIQLSLRNVSFTLKGPMESLKSLDKRVTFYLHLAKC